MIRKKREKSDFKSLHKGKEFIKLSIMDLGKNKLWEI